MLPRELKALALRFAADIQGRLRINVRAPRNWRMQDWRDDRKPETILYLKNRAAHKRVRKNEKRRGDALESFAGQPFGMRASQPNIKVRAPII